MQLNQTTNKRSELKFPRGPPNRHTQATFSCRIYAVKIVR